MTKVREIFHPCIRSYSFGTISADPVVAGNQFIRAGRQARRPVNPASFDAVEAYVYIYRNRIAQATGSDRREDPSVRFGADSLLPKPFEPPDS